MSNEVNGNHCVFKCRLPQCVCKKNSCILQINNRCNKNCHYCIQKDHHSNQKTKINKKVISSLFCDPSIDSINVIGGEFDLLDQEEKEFIYLKMKGFQNSSVITTNSMTLYYPDIHFNRHVTDFSVTIDKVDKYNMYNIVLNNEELPKIFDFIKYNSHIEFSVNYPRNQTIRDRVLLLKILNLGNIRMLGHGYIKQSLEQDISDKVLEKSLQFMYKKTCDSRLVIGYKAV